MIHSLYLYPNFLVLESLTLTKLICKPDSILTIVSSVDRKTCKKCIKKFHFRNLEILDLNDTQDKIQQYMNFIVRIEHTVSYIPNG